ncbi:hypothetical protein CC86DRAFT_397733 [Ophiobolus disseminans]|uniref:Ent-kaurene synthase n=1 Tax=Ophiobolus disseminans TaxID=1469910 RepID=A0A6A6ZIC9_9PLEO|nr:hypothetical protein CC86DRAFT_397733 [Ophiobolus disseminans]
MDFGSFSPSLYDTAWLAMITMEDEPTARLFPQCLGLLLQSQQPDGTWPSYASLTDGILVSLAALLSIATVRARSSVSAGEDLTYTRCIERGVVGLNKLLQSWDVGKLVHVGFELLTTSLMRQLEELSIALAFPGQANLTRLHFEKMRNVSPELLYGPNQTTLLHSVEAFVGVIEFEKIRHHCSAASGIFGSPAATAAYLIHSPEWDHEAERYLRKTVAAYGDTGEVPSAFPTPLFEMSWAFSSMLSPIINMPSLSGTDLSGIGLLFQKVLDQQGSLVGFAPGILEDADDTARCLIMLMRLRRLGYEVTANVAPLVEKFEADTCFKTYELESALSFSANCNVVLALLEAEDDATRKYAPQIEKALTTLLDTLGSGSRDIADKWNVSSEYSAMLFIEVMVVALELHDTGHLRTLPQAIFAYRIPRTICRIVSQLLAGQKSDGSWNQSLEVTSYGVLGLSHALRLPWASSICAYLSGQIAKATGFLETAYPKTKNRDYLWIEKTTYQSSLLRMAYCSMALHTTTTTKKWTKLLIETFSYISSQTSGMKKLFANLPLLAEVPEPLLDLILVEAKYHTCDLAAGTHSILATTDSSAKKTKYVGYVSVIWLLGNQINNQSLSAGVVSEMLRCSQLTYQMDYYMETTIAGLSREQAAFLGSWIQGECDAMKAAVCRNGIGEGVRYGEASVTDVNGDDHLSTMIPVQTTLRKFMHYMMHHPSVLRSPPLIRHHLATDLSAYLLAHMRQNSDNTRTSFWSLPSYFSWARSTGADHTSCPLAFRFFTCLISNSGRDFATAQAQYYASSVAHHLATMCRQYNDYGSIARDAEERNLNSVDFPEFRAAGCSTVEMNGDQANGEAMEEAKRKLMALAEFERKLMKLSFKALQEVAASREVMEHIKVLIDVTDLFGQLYVAKDVGIPFKNSKPNY